MNKYSSRKTKPDKPATNDGRRLKLWRGFLRGEDEQGVYRVPTIEIKIEKAKKEIEERNKKEDEKRFQKKNKYEDYEEDDLNEPGQIHTFSTQTQTPKVSPDSPAVPIKKSLIDQDLEKLAVEMEVNEKIRKAKIEVLKEGWKDQFRKQFPGESVPEPPSFDDR